MKEELNVLKNMVRVGTVSSVDVKSRTARVKFTDKNNLISGALKILKSSPAITIEKEVDGEKWDLTAQYATADRKFGLGESYTNTDPDTIILQKTIQYEKKESIPESTGNCTYTGVIEEKTHKHIVKVYPWIPYVGQLVLCIYMPNGGSDGFVIGGV
jgi:hypothetical protein